MDDNQSKTLDFSEFAKAMQDYRISTDQAEIQRIFALFDRDSCGSINYDEFLRAIVGEMNDRRKSQVLLAFARFDKDGSGIINIEDLKGVYNARQHPDVRSGKKSEEDVLYEFLDTFEQHYTLLVSAYSANLFQDRNAKDRNIRVEEFVEYYNNISASIDSDEYFELMIRNAWNLDNNQAYSQGWSN